jgi:hypothetical protein
MTEPEVFAEGGYEGGDALLKSLIASAGFIGKLLDSVFQALVCGPGLFSQVPYADAQLIDTAIGIAPQSLVLVAVFAPLLRDSSGDVLDAVKALFVSHARPFSRFNFSLLTSHNAVR